jgi:hypothetical protein
MERDAPAVVDHAAQSVYSDPGDWTGLFDVLEPTIEAVSFMARNVVAHYRAQASELPESSRDDISLRWVDAILATDQGRNPAPLVAERAVADRVQGCCRDHTLLAVAALRHHGVPARSRVGFATYLRPTWNSDHVIVEASMGGRWRRFDPEISAPIPNLPDPTDISPGPNSPFLTAGHAWLAHRAGSVDVNRFGTPDVPVLRGEWFVYRYVIAEVAHRFGDELLLWDTWGAMSGYRDRASPADPVLVDEIAHLLVRADHGDLQAERELPGRYRDDDRLRAGAHIRSFSPNGRLYAVDLTTRTTSPID